MDLGIGRLTIGNLLAYLSLAISIAFCFLGLSVAGFEMSSDRYIPDHQDVYRVERLQKVEGMTRAIPVVDPELRSTAINRFRPESAGPIQMARLENGRRVTIVKKAGSASVLGSGMAYAGDPEILQIFGLIDNSGQGAVPGNRADSIYLSRSLFEDLSTAETLRAGDPITLRTEETYYLAGIFEDFPRSSHLSFAALTPIVNRAMQSPDTLTAEDFANAPTGIIGGVIDTALYVRAPPSLASEFSDYLDGLSEQSSNPLNRSLSLTRVTDLYFNGMPMPGSRQGSQTLVIALAIISGVFFLLAIGQMQIFRTVSFNANAPKYYTLKSLGYTPLRMAGYFSTYYLVVTLFLLFASLLLAAAAFYLVGGSLSRIVMFEDIFTVRNIVGLGIALLVLVVLSTPPIEVKAVYSRPVWMKTLSKTAGSLSSISLQFIVAVNFALAVLFLNGLGTVHQNIVKFRSLDRGFSMSDMFLVTGWREDSLIAAQSGNMESVDRVMSGLRVDPSISDVVSASQSIPGDTPASQIYRGGASTDSLLEIPTLYVSPSFLRVFGVNMRAGEGFPESPRTNPGDGARASPVNSSVEIVISESARRLFGFESADAAIGHVISLQNGRRLTISGVTDDAIYSDQAGAEAGMVYISDPRRLNWIYARAADTAPGLTIGQLRLVPLRTRLESLLEAEKSRRALLTLLGLLVSMVAVVSCYNLFALLTHNMRKDLIVRQVYGYTFKPLYAHLLTKLFPAVLTGIVAGTGLSIGLILSVGTSFVSQSFLDMSGRAAGIALLSSGLALLILSVIVRNLSRKLDIDVLKDSNLVT